MILSKILPSIWDLFRVYWPVVLFVLAIAAGLLVHQCSPNDYVETATESQQQLVENEMAQDKEETRLLVDELQAEIWSLQDQVEQIRTEIAESIRERDEIHEKIEDATSIDAVDAVLWRNRRRSGKAKKRKARTDTGAVRVYPPLD